MWGSFGLVPISSEMVLSLRYTCLCPQADNRDVDLRHLILSNCWAVDGSVGAHLRRFHHLETLVAFESDFRSVVSTVAALPTSIRHVHILEQMVFIIWCHTPTDLPHLESFTFTLLLSEDTPADDGSDALAALQHAVESSVVAPPRCTFKYLCSTKAPEDALADALAAFGLDS